MAKKSANSGKDFTSLLESMFTANPNQETYYKTEGGNIIAGVKNSDGILQQARYYRTDASTPGEIAGLMRERQLLSEAKVRMQEIPQSQYADYDIVQQPITAGKPVAKRGKKVSGGSTADPEEIRIKDFLEGISQKMLNELRSCIVSGGNPYENYNPDFSIFKS